MENLDVHVHCRVGGSADLKGSTVYIHVHQCKTCTCMWIACIYLRAGQLRKDMKGWDVGEKGCENWERRKWEKLKRKKNNDAMV